MNFLANPNIVSPFFFKPGTIQLLSEHFFQNLAFMTHMLPTSPPSSLLSLLSATKPNEQANKNTQKAYGCCLNGNPGFASGYKGTPPIMHFL